MFVNHPGSLRYYFGRILIRLFRLKKKSYSWLNEDNVLDWLTGYKKSGIYIDIGANHPDRMNNTKLFYDRGWHGINIEPDTEGYKLFCEKRPNDININRAIGSGKAVYWFDDGGPNTSGGLVNTLNKDWAEHFGLKNKSEVELKPLREIFEENNLIQVDFISIDVEGFEEDVIKSNNWNKYRADVICLEGLKGGYLKKFGYRRVFWDGFNSYYKTMHEKNQN